MAEHDSDPLSPEERAELEQLRAEKAQREAEEKARRDRAELEALRAEKKSAQEVAKPAPAAKPVTASVKSSSASVANPTAKPAAKPSANKAPASKKAPQAKPAQKREDMSFAVRMVTSTEPAGEDEIPGMPPAQKIIIGIALIAFVIFIAYSVLKSAGAIG